MLDTSSGVGCEYPLDTSSKMGCEYPFDREESMSVNSYTTVSRKKILDFLKSSSEKTVTAADVDSYLKSKNSEVNITTIYRYLDKLSKEGTVIKYVAEKGSQTAYQYVEPGRKCEEHLHLKCVRCGKIIHLDCHFMQEISSHILDSHGFTLQCKNSMLYGICRDCKKEGNHCAQVEAITAKTV